MIQNVPATTNPFVQQFLSAGEFARNEEVEEIHLVIREIPGADLRRSNRPRTNEVAAILLDDNGTEQFDIVLHARNGDLRSIPDMHPAYDPLHVPLLFLYGEHGWSKELRYAGDVMRYNYKVSIKEFAGYRLHIKKTGFNIIHRGSRLFQKWCVEEYVKTEMHNLQSSLRAELYHEVQDMVGQDDHTLYRVGTHIVLPATFTGGERYMRKQYYDSMTIVRAFGKPDLFITVTCNPEWPEIQEALLPGQVAAYRPDIVARVFKLKLKAIMDDLIKKGVLGKIAARVHVIKFQKRGLPLAHMLIKLDETARPKTPEDYDKFVCAELPDPNVHLRLYAVVTSCMIHGPSPLHARREVHKGLPKDFVVETRHDENGYPVYKRPNNGQTVLRRGLELDNTWVVPYNPYLSAKFACHINVEICSTIESVKYLYKYVYKGHDRATVTTQAPTEQSNAAAQAAPGAAAPVLVVPAVSSVPVVPAVPVPAAAALPVAGSEQVSVVDIDEITQYQNGRYASPPEACWRIFKFELVAGPSRELQLRRLRRDRRRVDRAGALATHNANDVLRDVPHGSRRVQPPVPQVPSTLRVDDQD